MRIQDQFMLSLVMWRENRGGGKSGMQSVGNVILNRAAKRGTDAYTESVRPLQFSSITASGDPMLIKWPAPANQADYQAWSVALSLAQAAADGSLDDLTEGATLYYAPHGLSAAEISPVRYTLPDGSNVSFPKSWNPAAVRYTVSVAGQLFFAE